MSRFHSLALCAVVLLGLPAAAQNDMLGSLFDGPPALASTVLDPAAYVKVKVKKLSKGKVAYVNWKALGEILKGLGYSNPPTELTPELSAQILAKASFAIPITGESADTYAEEFRTLYAIRYGGNWLNGNFGSGRNGAAGLVDIKGIGQTSLVRPWADSGHSNGTMSLADSIKEAVWSNILHEELPLGANRVLFIITTGTRVNPADPKSEPRALVVREDPLRPAYFQPNPSVNSDLMSESLRRVHTEGDRLRLQRVLPRLLDALPTPKNLPANATAQQKLQAGFLHFIDAVALQYATGYTRQIHMAGISTSNVQIDGVALDYGATSGLVGFPRVMLTEGESPHGTTDSMKSDLILELAGDLREVLPQDLARAIPSDQVLAARVDRQFRRRLLQNFLELAGTPKEFSESLLRTREGFALAKTLLQIAQAGNDRIEPWDKEKKGHVGRTGTYNLENILNALVKNIKRADWQTSVLQSPVLRRELSDDSLRARLITGFSEYLKVLGSAGAAHQISEGHLKEYIRRAVSARNTSMDDVRDQWSLWLKFFAASKAHFEGSDSYAVQNQIDQLVEKSIHEFKAGPFRLETADDSGVAGGLIQRSVFDLKSGAAQNTYAVLPGFKDKLTMGGRKTVNVRALGCELSLEP